MPVDASLDPGSLERIIPELLESDGTTGQATLELHMERYRFAVRHMRPGRLLDIACGVGYGSDLLVRECTQISSGIGADLSSSAISYASDHYQGPRLKFLQADAMKFHEPAGFDNIVSLETIEHLPDPAQFIRRMAAMLRPGGVLIGSVPVTPSMDGNPHHLTDFSERSFRHLFAGHGLEEIGHLRQIQPFSAIAILGKKEKRVARDHAGVLAFYREHPAKLFSRVGATLRYGFQNRYLTLAWSKRF